jgi:hypothetical protein
MQMHEDLGPAAAGVPTDGQTEIGGGEYEPVEGRDRQSIECQRACEAVAAKKTASDYDHIVWAYGIIWALFCAYGVLLWRRSQRLAADVEALTRRLDAQR